MGAPVDLRDVLITGNAKHFKRIRGLTVIEYRRGRNAER